MNLFLCSAFLLVAIHPSCSNAVNSTDTIADNTTFSEENSDKNNSRNTAYHTVDSTTFDQTTNLVELPPNDTSPSTTDKSPNEPVTASLIPSSFYVSPTAVLEVHTVKAASTTDTLASPSPTLEPIPISTQRETEEVLKTVPPTTKAVPTASKFHPSTESVTTHHNTVPTTLGDTHQDIVPTILDDDHRQKVDPTSPGSHPKRVTISPENIHQKTTTTMVAFSEAESVEQNAILATTDSGDDHGKEIKIVVGHKCTRLFQDSVLWNDTDGGMLALKSCPSGYQGNMYRPCFSSGKWGNVDYSECRLERLGRMRHMIVHQVEKGMLGNMYVLAEEFSKYLSSVEMKSPMDRLEAFEILNTFLKLDMNLKMDKTRDTKYIQILLHSCNELIRKKTVRFSQGSQENKLITEKAVEMIFDLTYFAERSLRGLLKTQKKQIAFRSSPNVVLYLYRGKHSGKFSLAEFSSEHEREEEISNFFNLEKTLERSAYALIWIKGLRDLLSKTELQINSDIAVATIVSPMNSLSHMAHPPTFDIGLKLEKAELPGYTLQCGQLWNMSSLWNTDDCTKASVKGNIVTCRCHHLGSIALLLQQDSQDKSLLPPIGKAISASCTISLIATAFTFLVNFFLKRGEQHVSVLIFVNMLICMIAIQLLILYGINRGGQAEICMSSAILLHYIFMVLCCWVVAYSYNLLKKLRSSVMGYVGRPRDYFTVCYMVPLMMLIVAFVFNPHQYETRLYCWMSIQRGILWSFVFPVTGLIVVNTVVMILALKTFNEQKSATHRTEICKTRNSLRAGLTLLQFVAVNWFSGILAVANPYNTGLQAMFCISNVAQSMLTLYFFCLTDTNIQKSFLLRVGSVSRRPKVSAMRLTKSGSFPILERSLITLNDDRRRLDCTPLLAGRTAYHDVAEDPCCSNIRV